MVGSPGSVLVWRWFRGWSHNGAGTNGNTCGVAMGRKFALAHLDLRGECADRVRDATPPWLIRRWNSRSDRKKKLEGDYKTVVLRSTALSFDEKKTTALMFEAVFTCYMLY